MMKHQNGSTTNCADLHIYTLAVAAGGTGGTMYYLRKIYTRGVFAIKREGDRKQDIARKAT